MESQLDFLLNNCGLSEATIVNAINDGA